MDITKFMNNSDLETIKKEHGLNIKNDINNYFMINYTKNEETVSETTINYFSGTILEKDTNNLLYYFKGTTKKNVVDYFNQNKNHNSFYVKNVYKGPILKIFSYKGKWFVSTSYHTNAKLFYPKKNGQNLYLLFKDVIIEKGSNMSFFWNNLNKNYCYTFVIKHKDLGDKVNSLIFLSKYDLFNKKEYDNKLFKQKVNYKFNIIIPPLSKVTSSNILKQIKQMNQPQKYILIEKDSNDVILNKTVI